MKLKILSWNIWISGDFEKIKAFLKKAGADILGLQELQEGEAGGDLVDFLENLGYQMVFLPIRQQYTDKVWKHGPAVFSKYKITNSDTFLLPGKEPRGVVRADIEVGDKTLHVFSTHLVHTHQQQSDEQESQVRELVSKLTTEHTVVMGDFNATPESQAIRAMKNILLDSDPTSQPTWSMHTDGCPVCDPQKVDTRLDYIFTSKDMQTRSFKVEQAEGSDHLSVSVEVEV